MWSTSWLFLLEAVIIVAGNVTTIVIFSSTRRLHSRKFVLIVNMAIADLFVGSITLPLYVYWREAPNEEVYPWFEKAFTFIEVFFGTASIFSLASLAIERAHATFFPFKHEALTNFSYKIGISVVWMAALTNAILSLSVLPRNPRLHSMAVVLGITLSIVCITYFLIWIKVICKRNPSVHQSNKRLTITVGIVTCASFITLMPILVVSVYGLVCGSCLDSLQWSLVTVVSFFYCGNSAVNVFIYAMRMRAFRIEISRRILCCFKSSNSYNERIEMQHITNVRDDNEE